MVGFEIRGLLYYAFRAKCMGDCQIFDVVMKYQSLIQHDYKHEDYIHIVTQHFHTSIKSIKRHNGVD